MNMIEHSDKDLLGRESHFAFGKNWESYAELIDSARISEAQRSLGRLLGNEGLAGKRFLDIGCGSGLHSLAALRLGATEVLAVDIDTDSVATAAAVLSRHAPGKNFTVRQVSVFEMAPAAFGQFDVVYSWGVLHHTGDLSRALRSASALVAPGGVFVFALYRKTWSCGFWKLEKRWYTHAGASAQKKVRKLYLALYRVGLWIRGRSFKRYVESYKTRGMDFYHDVHDWLGGYPYESMSPREVAGLMTQLHMVPIRSFVHLGRLGRLLGRNPGFLGSGCDEYVYARRRDSAWS